MTTRPRFGSIVIHAGLLAGAAIFALPFVWMVLTSFKPPDEIFTSSLGFWPQTFYGRENYHEALTAVPLWRFMVNGAVVCGAILVLQVLIAAPCGYALAKLPFPGRPVVFAAVLVALLIPIQVPALPLYLAFASIGIIDTYTALITPFVISVFATFLFRQFFKAFPDEIIDAARLDGYGELEIVWRVALPSAWPAVAAFSIFSIVAHWNDLFWPLVVISSPEMMTPPLGIAHFRATSDMGANVGPLMAGGVLVTLPLVVVFLLAQRQFMRGLSLTGVR